MICQDPKDFVTRLERLPPKASIIVFKARQFPLRGPVDIAEAMACIPDGTEFVLLIFDVSGQSIVEHREGISHEELRDYLEEYRDQLVALGPFPPWLEDNDEVISAVVPDRDGTLRMGVY